MLKQKPWYETANHSNGWLIVRAGFWNIDGQEIVVKAGTTTDLATIPRLFRWLIPVNGKHRDAATLHDDSYTRAIWGRKRCDEVFLNEMKLANVKYVKRYAMFWIVRAFGWAFWNKARVADDA